MSGRLHSRSRRLQCLELGRHVLQLSHHLLIRHLQRFGAFLGERCASFGAFGTRTATVGVTKGRRSGSRRRGSSGRRRREVVACEEVIACEGIGGVGV